MDDASIMAGLTPAMRSALRLGINGATGGTLSGLQRRGLIREVPERSNVSMVVYGLTEAGERIADALKVEAGMK